MLLGSISSRVCEEAPRGWFDSATAKNERLTKKSERKQEELGETWRRGRSAEHPGLDFRLSFLHVTTQNKRWRCRGRFKRHDRKSEHKQSDIFGEGMKLIRKNSLTLLKFPSTWTFAGRSTDSAAGVYLDHTVRVIQSLSPPWRWWQKYSLVFLLNKKLMVHWGHEGCSSYSEAQQSKLWGLHFECFYYPGTVTFKLSLMHLSSSERFLVNGMFELVLKGCQ